MSLTDSYRQTLKKIKRFLLIGFGLLVLSGCTRLSSIPYSPEQTPETWLTIQPYVEITIGSLDFIFVQPFSSALVYGLGMVTIAVGIYFLRIQKGQYAHLWWGVALLLWGGGALLAATSYEAFSYEIKCAGQTVCSWTSWWEVFYLIFSAASIEAMLVAEAYTCVTGKWRKRLIILALVKTVLYTGMALIGALIPIKFLISFELLVIFAAPNVVVFFLLSGWRYYQLKHKKDLALLGAWSWLALTLGAYFLYLMLGFTQQLWEQDIWFSDNDVLHIGLIIWMVYIALVLAKWVEDEPETSRE